MVVFRCSASFRRRPTPLAFPKALALLSPLVVLLLVGCAATPPTLTLQRDEVRLRWPAPPEPARIQWLGELIGEANFPRRQRTGPGRALAWLVGWMVGAAPPTRLRRPLSGAVWGERIYVTDPGLHAVVVFDGSAGRLFLWRQVGGQALVTPVGVAPVGDGTLWLSDADLGQVFHLDAQGRLLGKVEEGHLHRPAGVCMDGRGRLLVADSQAHRIVLFDARGRWLGQWGEDRGREPGHFNGPTHLACAEDRVAVADTLNARIQILDLDGRPMQVLGRRGDFLGDTPRPKGVAWDRDGHLYVVESLFDHLLVYDREGRALLPIGGSGASPGRFQLPAGAWSDGEDRIFIADMFNARVAVLRYLGRGAANGQTPNDRKQP